jgi:hypothetical protein
MLILLEQEELPIQNVIEKISNVDITKFDFSDSATIQKVLISMTELQMA